MESIAPGITIAFAPRRLPAAEITGWCICQSNGHAHGRWHFFVRSGMRSICGNALGAERSDQPGAYTEQLSEFERNGVTPVCGSCDRMRRRAAEATS